MTISTKQIRTAEEFLHRVKVSLAYGHKVEGSDIRKCELISAVIEGNAEVDEYRAISLRLDAIRSAAKEARRRAPKSGDKPSGHAAEGAEVSSLIARRAELAMIIANRQAHLEDHHGHGSRPVK